jgi:hypothetical protein
VFDLPSWREDGECFGLRDDVVNLSWVAGLNACAQMPVTIGELHPRQGKARFRCPLQMWRSANTKPAPQSLPKQLRNMIRMPYTGVIGKEWVG